MGKKEAPELGLTDVREALWSTFDNNMKELHNFSGYMEPPGFYMAYDNRITYSVPDFTKYLSTGGIYEANYPNILSTVVTSFDGKFDSSKLDGTAAEFDWVRNYLKTKNSDPDSEYPVFEPVVVPEDSAVIHGEGEASFIVRFNKQMNEETLTPETIVVKALKGGEVPSYTVTPISPLRFAIVFDELLKNDRDYEVSFAGDVKDRLGTALQAGTKLNYRVGKGDSDGGSGGYYPPVTPVGPVQLADHQQLVRKQDVEQAKNNQLSIVLAPGKTEAVFATEVVQLIEHDVMFQSGDAFFTLPADWFAQLAAQLQESGSDGKNVKGSVIVRITEMPSEELPLIDRAYELAGAAYQLEIVLVDGEGKETKASLKGSPLKVEMPFELAGRDEALLGLYGYDPIKKQWQYFGGKQKAEQTMKSTAPYYEQYAVLEYTKTFTDVLSTHWVYRPLQVLAAQHLIQGVTETSFKPEAAITRAEFTAMLVRMLKLKLEVVVKPLPFTDVAATDWYAEEIAAAYAAGLIQGISADYFAPDERITREQLAVLVMRAFEWQQQSKVAESSTFITHQDLDQVSSWAKDEVNTVLGLGIMKGKSAVSFAPQSNASRAESAQVLWNLIREIEE